MDAVKRVVQGLDRFQRSNRVLGPAYAVVKKFSDDRANLFVVSLGWYGFTAIYPLLLVVVTVFGFIGVGSLGRGIVDTLHQFPVIGTQFTPGHGGSDLHGSVFGLVVGLLGLLYGAQGVTQVALQAMARIWHLPQLQLPRFLPRLGRSLVGLTCIGAAFLVSSFVGSLAVAHGQALAVRVFVLLGMLALDICLYLAAFLVLSPSSVRARQLLPGSLLGGTCFTVLTTVGTGLVEHQLRNTSAT